MLLLCSLVHNSQLTNSQHLFSFGYRIRSGLSGFNVLNCVLISLWTEKPFSFQFSISISIAKSHFKWNESINIKKNNTKFRFIYWIWVSLFGWMLILWIINCELLKCVFVALDRFGLLSSCECNYTKVMNEWEIRLFSVLHIYFVCFFFQQKYGTERKKEKKNEHNMK